MTELTASPSAQQGTWQVASTKDFFVVRSFLGGMQVLAVLFPVLGLGRSEPARETSYS